MGLVLFLFLAGGGGEGGHEGRSTLYLARFRSFLICKKNCIRRVQANILQ